MARNEISVAPKNYDFKNPERISKDQLRHLTLLFEGFARVIAMDLSGVLRGIVQVLPEESKQTTFSDVLSLWKEFDCLAVYSLAPLMNGSTVLEIDPSILFAMIDRMLGGQGKPIKEVRDFTDIEMALIRRLFSRMANGVKEVWQSIGRIEPQLLAVETNPNLFQEIHANDLIFYMSYNISFGENTAKAHLCVPHLSLEEVLPKIGAHLFGSKGRLGKKIAETDITDLSLNIYARFPEQKYPMSKLQAIKTGDIILFNERVLPKINVFIEDKIAFRGAAGRHKNKKAVLLGESRLGKA